jgi:hypothetical protein
LKRLDGVDGSKGDVSGGNEEISASPKKIKIKIDNVKGGRLSSAHPSGTPFYSTLSFLLRLR